MKIFKLNALEMAKINGGTGSSTDINPDGSCAKVENCGCSQYSQSKADYTAHRNNADSAWGA
jgi:hypothetical protein